MVNKYCISSNNELYHYGIKGQKWGVRRYQDVNGRLTAKGKERYHNTKSGMSIAAGMLPDNLRNGVYTEDSFQEVTGRYTDDGKIHWRMPLNKDLRKERLRQEYLDDPDSVFETHMNKINKTNGDENGTSNNCTKIVANMVLARKEGLDYDAGRCVHGVGEAFEYWFDGAERTLVDNLQEAIDTKFANTKNGSYGSVDMRNKNGGGHVFVWERNSKGDFNLYEGQPKEGEKFSGSSPSECFDKYLTKRPWFSRESTVRIYDLTDATPNYDHMSEDSVVRITDDPSYMSIINDRHTGKLYKDL